MAAAKRKHQSRPSSRRRRDQPRSSSNADEVDSTEVIRSASKRARTSTEVSKRRAKNISVTSSRRSRQSEPVPSKRRRQEPESESGSESEQEQAQQSSEEDEQNEQLRKVEKSSEKGKLVAKKQRYDQADDDGSDSDSVIVKTSKFLAEDRKSAHHPKKERQKRRESDHHKNHRESYHTSRREKELNMDSKKHAKGNRRTSDERPRKTTDDTSESEISGSEVVEVINAPSAKDREKSSTATHASKSKNDRRISTSKGTRRKPSPPARFVPTKFKTKANRSTLPAALRPKLAPPRSASPEEIEQISDAEEKSANQSDAESEPQANRRQQAAFKASKVAVKRDSSRTKLGKEAKEVKKVGKAVADAENTSENDSSGLEDVSEPVSSGKHKKERPRAVPSVAKKAEEHKSRSVSIVKGGTQKPEASKTSRGFREGFKGMRKSTVRVSPPSEPGTDSDHENYRTATLKQTSEPVHAASSDSEDEILLTSPGKRTTASPKTQPKPQTNLKGGLEFSGEMVQEKEADNDSGPELESTWVPNSNAPLVTDMKKPKKGPEPKRNAAIQSPIMQLRDGSEANSQSSGDEHVAESLQQKSVLRTSAGPVATRATNSSHRPSPAPISASEDEEDKSPGLFEYAEDLRDLDYQITEVLERVQTTEIKMPTKGHERAPSSVIEISKIEKVESTKIKTPVPRPGDDDIPVPLPQDLDRQILSIEAETFKPDASRSISSTPAVVKNTHRRKRKMQTEVADIPVPGIEDLQEDEDFLLPPALSSAPASQSMRSGLRESKKKTEPQNSGDHENMPSAHDSTARPKRDLGKVRKTTANSVIVELPRRKRKSFSPDKGTSVRAAASSFRAPPKRLRTSLADKLSSEDDEDDVQVAKSSTLYNADGTLKEKSKPASSRFERQPGQDSQKDFDEDMRSHSGRGESNFVTASDSDIEHGAEKPAVSIEVDGNVDLDNLADLGNLGDRGGTPVELPSSPKERPAAQIETEIDLAASEAQAQAQADADPQNLAPNEPIELGLATPTDEAVLGAEASNSVEIEQQEDLMGQSTAQPVGIADNVEDDREQTQLDKISREASEVAEALVTAKSGNLGAGKYTPPPTVEETRLEDERSISIWQTAPREGEDSESDDVSVVKRSAERPGASRRESQSPAKKDREEAKENTLDSPDPSAIVSRTFGRGSRGTKASKAKVYPVVEIDHTPNSSPSSKLTKRSPKTQGPPPLVDPSAIDPAHFSSPALAGKPAHSITVTTESRRRSKALVYDVEEPDESYIIYDEFEVTVVEIEEDSFNLMIDGGENDSEDASGIGDDVRYVAASEILRADSAELPEPASTAEAAALGPEAAFSSHVHVDAEAGADTEMTDIASEKAPDELEQMHDAVAAKLDGLNEAGVIADSQLRDAVENLATVTGAGKIADHSEGHDVVAAGMEVDRVSPETVNVEEASHENEPELLASKTTIAATSSASLESDEGGDFQIITTVSTEVEIPETIEGTPETSLGEIDTAPEASNQGDGFADHEDSGPDASAQGSLVVENELIGEEDAEGDDYDDMASISEKPFSVQNLHVWVNELKGKGEEDLIGVQSVNTLFVEQMKLAMDGPHPLLLAWKLSSSSLHQYDAYEFLVFLTIEKIDSSTKLSLYLEHLANTVFGISSHTRFLSQKTADGVSVPPVAVKTLRVPEAYTAFYMFCYVLLKDSDTDTLTIEVAMPVWNTILAPYFPVSKDFLLFVKEKAAAHGVVSQEMWKQLLEFCQSVFLPGPDEGPGLLNFDSEAGSYHTLIDEYATWVKNGRLEQAPDDNITSSTM